MTPKVIANFNNKISFPFQYYCDLIVSIPPKSDIVGISNIIFQNNISKQYNCPEDSLACHLVTGQGKRSDIIVDIGNLQKSTIPEYLFNRYKEIAGLLLSEIICHEIGHHVHKFYRHGVGKRDQEKFADRYAKAGYYNYLKLRLSKILLSYKLASLNFVEFDRHSRKLFVLGYAEIKKWVEENKNGISFP